MRYPDEAGVLWRTYVPRRSQAETVQGELIRAVEKLRDEAQRNGNVNWDSDFVVLAEYLRSKLRESGLFSDSEVGDIDRDVDLLLNYEVPETSDDPYDRLIDRVVEWARSHPDPLPNEMNPNLKR